jgi:hypothetical protein
MTHTARIPFFTLAPANLTAMIKLSTSVKQSWAEAVNALPQQDNTDAAYAELKEHFNETQIAEIGYAISVIKGWNLLNLSLRNQVPEVPAPGF